MFERFPAQWTPVELTSRVRAGRVVRARIAGEDIALVRARDGRLGALIDRCPHRGVALSLGTVQEDGTLQCAFHGWRFDLDGRCAHVPMCEVSDAARARSSATSIPVREAGGLVWICTTTSAPPEMPALHPMLADERAPRSFVVEEWATHWTRAMENMLDFPHLPFVHRRTIGRGVRATMQSGGAMELELTPRPFGMEIVARLGTSRLGSLEWRRPNAMVLPLVIEPGRRIVQHVFCVPVDDRRTKMIVVATRDWGRHNPLLWLADLFNARVLAEDRAVVESSSPAEVPEPGAERSVILDAPTLEFRRWYLRELLAPRPDIPTTRLARAS